MSEREERIKEIVIYLKHNSGYDIEMTDGNKRYFETLDSYVEAKVREAKREAYKESLRAYRQDKLINWQEYIEKQIIHQNSTTNEKEKKNENN